MDATDYSLILACNYGTSRFAIERYSVRSQAHVTPGIGRTATVIDVEIEGVLTAANAAAFSDAMLAAVVDLQTDGRDLLITGLAGETEYQLLAAQCYDGGPHVDSDFEDGPTGLSKKIRFRVRALQPPNLNSVLDSYRVALTIGPDNLQTLVRSGMVNGPNAIAYFIAATLPAFQAIYAAPHWVVSYQYDTGEQTIATLVRLTYRLTAKQTFGPLPSFGSASGEDGSQSLTAAAVDGSATKRTDRDEHHRLTTTLDFDLLVLGDAMALLSNELRPTTGVVLRESVSVEGIKQNRLRATFVVLTGDDPSSPLMSWTETVRSSYSTPTWEEKTYIGAAPILVRRPDVFPRLVQSGTASGAGAYRQEPEPFAALSEHQPEVSFNDVNDVEKVTSWNYAGFLADAEGNPGAVARGTPAVPLIQLARDQQPKDVYQVEEDPSEPDQG